MHKMTCDSKINLFPRVVLYLTIYIYLELLTCSYSC